MLPFQTVLLVVLFAVLLPVLRRAGLVSWQPENHRLPW